MLQPNRARIFVFNLVVYRKKHFSKSKDKLFLKLFKNKFFKFKKLALLWCRDKSSLHSDTNPRSVSLKLREKALGHDHLLFDP